MQKAKSKKCRRFLNFCKNNKIKLQYLAVNHKNVKIRILFSLFFQLKLDKLNKSEI